MIPDGTILRSRYQITKSLAGGSFGDTYLAKDLDLPGKPPCVVKHLKPKDNRPDVLKLARRLFDTEAKVLYNLGNQSVQIPTLFAHFEENSEFYLVQEFIDGHDLNTEIVPGKKLSESSVITLLKDILEVLAVAHEHQPNAAIHRDIKPANLMRHRQDGKIILIDFGAVREINQLIVNVNGGITTTIAIGTLGYLPSEQARGKPKLCSDVYAVGMIGIQALTGIWPLQLEEDPNTGEVIWRHLVPKINPKFADVLEKMVRDRFSQRYQNAGEALQAILSLSQPTPPPQPPANSFIMVQRLMEVLGKLKHIITECIVAVAGIALRSIVAVPVVMGIRRAIATGSSVFAWLLRLRSLRFSVPCCSHIIF